MNLSSKFVIKLEKKIIIFLLCVVFKHLFVSQSARHSVVITSVNIDILWSTSHQIQSTHLVTVARQLKGSFKKIIDAFC